MAERYVRVTRAFTYGGMMLPAGLVMRVVHDYAVVGWVCGVLPSGQYLILDPSEFTWVDPLELAVMEVLGG